MFVTTHHLTWQLWKHTFYRSGFQCPSNVPGVADAAALFLGHRSLDPGSGLLLAVPIPAENAADGREIEDAIQVGEEIRLYRAPLIGGPQVP